MKCPKCEFDVEEGFSFCPKCGSSVSAASGMEGASLGDLKTMAGIPREAGEVSMGDMNTRMGPGEVREGLQQTPSDSLSERYELKEEIGRGGFARVWKARDTKLDRLVAVKRLVEPAVKDANWEMTVQRFRREAQAIAGLNHRNIVGVYDVGLDAEGDYLVMELVEGGSLQSYVKQKGKLDPEEAVELIKGVAQGLGYAHKKNLVHRDVKPANVLLLKEGNELTPKLVDFGLARVGTDSELSMTGYGMGTPWYMPPEQRRDAKGVNHTADIYALGKTLYELLTGEVPDQVDADKVAPGLAKVILKCVKNAPEERYFSAEEVVDALEGTSTVGRQRGSSEEGDPAERNECPSCGRANSRDVKFCESCGTGLTRPCPECGRENSIHKVFCGGCGTDVEVFTQVAEAVSRMENYLQEKKWSRVEKELGLIPEDRRMPGEKGKELESDLTRMREACAKQQEREKVAKERWDQILPRARKDYEGGVIGDAVATIRKFAEEAEGTRCEREAKALEEQWVKESLHALSKQVDTLMGQKQWSKAQAFLELGGELDPKDSLLMQRKQQVEAQIQKVDQAIQKAHVPEELEQALAEWVDHPDAEKLRVDLQQRIAEAEATEKRRAALRRKQRQVWMVSGGTVALMLVVWLVMTVVSKLKTNAFVEKTREQIEQKQWVQVQENLAALQGMNVDPERILDLERSLPKARVAIVGAPAGASVRLSDGSEVSDVSDLPVPSLRESEVLVSALGYESKRVEVPVLEPGEKHEIGVTLEKQKLPKDLVAVEGAKLAPLGGLAAGSREAQARQVAESEKAGLPLEVKSAKVGMVFRYVPSGEFVMGSPAEEASRDGDEGPQTRVTLSKGMYVGKYEVTQEEWERVMGSNPSNFKNAGKRAPVEQVSWEECQEFLKKLCALEGVPDGTYRLLTEAEWEYACRAGTTGPYAGELEQMGWYSSNSVGTTKEVGEKLRNAFGLYDMHGNVYEWCGDWYGSKLSGGIVKDPFGPASGSYRVIRGGSWCDYARYCRSAVRDWYPPDLRWFYLGLRLMRTVPPSVE
jgi:formylglycine-generating enzyme required for sulfatase activity/serine/threonine protein kinase